MVILSICVGILVEICAIVYTIKNWNNPEVDSATMVLMLLFGGLIAAVFSVVLIPIAVIWIPIWVITKLRNIN